MFIYLFTTLKNFKFIFMIFFYSYGSFKGHMCCPVHSLSLTDVLEKFHYMAYVAYDVQAHRKICRLEFNLHYYPLLFIIFIQFLFLIYLGVDGGWVGIIFSVVQFVYQTIANVQRPYECLFTCAISRGSYPLQQVCYGAPWEFS